MAANSKSFTLNDRDRAGWVLNDEDLYNWWKTTRPRPALGTFVKRNREELDRIIKQKLGHT